MAILSGIDSSPLGVAVAMGLADGNGKVNPKREQSGTVTGMSFIVNTYSTKTVTFPKAFDHVPNVKAWCSGGNCGIVNASWPSKTGFTLRTFGLGAVNYTDQVDWEAKDLEYMFGGGLTHVRYPVAVAAAISDGRWRHERADTFPGPRPGLLERDERQFHLRSGTTDRRLLQGDDVRQQEFRVTRGVRTHNYSPREISSDDDSEYGCGRHKHACIQLLRKCGHKRQSVFGRHGTFGRLLLDTLFGQLDTQGRLRRRLATTERGWAA